MPPEAKVSAGMRFAILDLYGSTCQLCARGPGDPDRTDPGRRTRLIVRPIDDSRPSGDDSPCNLHVVCRACDVSPPCVAASPGLVALMGQVRRATERDQRRALDWLQRKFAREQA